MSGDLARKKIFPALYSMVKKGILDVPVIGVASSQWTVADLRKRAADSIDQYGGGVDDGDAFERLTGLLRYIDGDYRADETYTKLRQELGDASCPIHYLAIPPSMFPVVIEGLGRSGCAENGRVIVEKPFGRDLASAQELNRVLHGIFPEERIFRIDHYLGKEAVEDLLVFRLSNMLLEPVWNRNYVRSVQVTMAESIGVEGRGSFYEEVG
ncbi:MAG TPA: glucose-6-phosphate dehydrogenase, partial [Acidimicrobiia bacterium]|nr:glucose-6-phosphate dehydrogenase [Acidimicrobiia bacterium]